MRGLIFTLWIYSGKTAEGTISALETLAANQFETVSHGSGRMVRASLSGKSFDYELPPNWGPDDFIESVRVAYKKVLLGGASGGQMTDTELQNFVLDSDNEVTDTLIARVSNYGIRT